MDLIRSIGVYSGQTIPDNIKQNIAESVRFNRFWIIPVQTIKDDPTKLKKHIKLLYYIIEFSRQYAQTVIAADPTGIHGNKYRPFPGYEDMTYQDIYEDIDLLVLTGLCPNNETKQEQADRYALNGILGSRARSSNKLTVLLDDQYSSLPVVSQSNSLRAFVKEMEASNGVS